MNGDMTVAVAALSLGLDSQGDEQGAMSREEFRALAVENRTAAMLELWDRLEAAELNQAVILGQTEPEAETQG